MFRLGHNAINLGQPVNRSAPLNRGLLGWWLSLPSRSIARLPGLTGDSTHGTLTNGAYWSSLSRPGGLGSIGLDGSNDCVVLPSVSGSITTDITVSAWANISNTNSFRMIVSADTSGSYGTGGFELRTNGSGIIQFMVDENGGSLNRPTATGSATYVGEWKHYTGTYNNSVVSIYVDGLLIASASPEAGTITGINTSSTRIGDRPSGGQALAGFVDDVRIYNRALSASEVLALYNASRMGYINELNRISRPIGVKGAAGSAFKAAWARRSNQVIGVSGAA